MTILIGMAGCAGGALLGVYPSAVTSERSVC